MRAFLLLLVPVVALAVPLAPASITASTTYPTENGFAYYAKHLLDDRASTVWIEGDRGSGLGSWVQVDLGAAVPVAAVQIWNGNWYSLDFWTRHNRAKDVELSFSDGSKQAFTLKDVYAPETLTLPAALTTSSVKLKIKSVYAGSTFGDTCLSGLRVFGAIEAPVVAKASSTYPKDADATYDASNAVDGMVDTMWCEGDKKGDGVGQWIEVQFPAARTVGSLRVVNGNGASDEDNAKANRARQVTLGFDDGSKATVALAPQAAEQTLTFPPTSTARVRVTVDAVEKGSEFNDLCFSELGFE